MNFTSPRSQVFLHRLSLGAVWEYSLYLRDLIQGLIQTVVQLQRGQFGKKEQVQTSRLIVTTFSVDGFGKS